MDSNASAAEDAVAKAKAIAAKLSGTATSSTINDTTDTNNMVNAMDVAAAAEAALAAAANFATPSTGTGTTGSSTDGKRKRWGVADDTNTNGASAAAADDSLSSAAKKVKHAAQKHLWISTCTSPADDDTKKKPASHYRLYWNAHGASISRQVSNGEIVLSLQGRGSSLIPALPGIPEQPLHILIEGPSVEACEQAESLVETLFCQKAEEAELMVDPEQNSAASAAANGAGPTPATNGYQPASASSLIHIPASTTPGHYGHAAAPAGAVLLEEQIGVPNGVVGYIIGRGGESIASMQARTSCKVQIQKENEMNPGQTQRVITLQATTQEAIAACRDIIQNMVNERCQTNNNAGGSGSFNNNNNHSNSNGNSSQEVRLAEAVQSGHVLVTVAVPDTDVGLIIGKSGSTIKGIQDRSGANIQIPQAADLDNPSIRTVSITHPHPEGAALAKQLMEDILGSKRNSVPHITIQVEIPDQDVGMCIGRSGCVIREMQNQSGTKIQIPSFSTPGMLTRIATVVGPPDGCNRVKQMIERIVLEQSSQSVMSGQAGGGGGGMMPQAGGQYNNGHHGYGAAAGVGAYGATGGYQAQVAYGAAAAYGQPQAAAYGGGAHAQQHAAYGQQQYGATPQAGGAASAAAGQQDYSKEWAAYYAAQAAASGGGAAVQQHHAAAVAPAAAPSPAAASPAAAATTTGQGADAYFEQFHRYAYYYGDEAARSYYGAWSPPVGTPNPYGVNPNGITAAPAAAPGAGAPTTAAPAASAPAPAAPAANVRDTGRRGVSNLPAWMTKS